MVHGKTERRQQMSIESHIAAIKEHLKAIESEKQSKKESKRYLVVEVDADSPREALWGVTKRARRSHDYLLRAFDDMEKFFLKGKIITVNEE